MVASDDIAIFEVSRVSVVYLWHISVSCICPFIPQKQIFISQFRDQHRFLFSVANMRINRNSIYTQCFPMKIFFFSLKNEGLGERMGGNCHNIKYSYLLRWFKLGPFLVTQSESGYDVGPLSGICVQ